MSRGFVKEEDFLPPPAIVPRPPLPPGTANFVRPEGLAKLQAEAAALQAEIAEAEQDKADAQARTVRLNALNTQMAQLQQRIATARLVDPAAQPQKEVRFGAIVKIGTTIGRKEMPERTFTIVGVDEADISQGLIAFTSPLARALQGLKKGGKAHLRTGRGEEELVVLAVGY